MKILNFLRRVKDFIVRNEKEIMLTCIIALVSFLVCFSVLNTYIFANSMSEAYMFIGLFSYFFTLIFLYASSKKIRMYLNSHMPLINVLSLLVPLIVFSFQLASDTLLTTLAAENAIRQSNNTNFIFVNSTEDSSLLQLDSSVYQKYWEYIQKNYSLKCRDAYIRMILSIDEFNAINKQRQALDIAKIQSSTPTQTSAYSKLDAEYSQSALAFASSTKTNLSFAIKNCQDLKQSLDRN